MTQQHDCLRHAADCLEEAKAAAQLARKLGQMNPLESEELTRRLDDLVRMVERRDDAG